MQCQLGSTEALLTESKNSATNSSFDKQSIHVMLEFQAKLLLKAGVRTEMCLVITSKTFKVIVATATKQSPDEK